jgi:hypothetical protein
MYPCGRRSARGRPTVELDESVYPDRAPPDELARLEERSDYVQRICGAFDFGIPPEGRTDDCQDRF